MGCGNSSETKNPKGGKGGPDPFFDLILNEDIQKNQYPKILDSHKSEQKVSLMGQAMNKDLFNEYKDIKTKQAGWTIARAINTGVMHPSSFVGCHAGDLESYKVYSKLFNPVIKGYHVGFDPENDKHVTNLDVSKITTDLTDSAKSKIISTRIRVARNLAFFPLNPAASQKNREDIADLMEKVFANLPEGFKGQFLRHTTMTDKERQSLIDDHFLFRGKDKMQAASGYHQFWPIGRGIFHNQSKDFLLWINEGDHLRIISMEKGGDVKQVFSRLAEGIKLIEQGVKEQRKGIEGVNDEDPVFMMDPSLGCITCCPSNLGTGMRGSVHILVPKLIKTIGFDNIDKMARAQNCQARGSTGEHSEVVDRIDISNWRRLGFEESALVQDMIKCANFFSDLEDECDGTNKPQKFLDWEKEYNAKNGIQEEATEKAEVQKSERKEEEKPQEAAQEQAPEQKEEAPEQKEEAPEQKQEEAQPAEENKPEENKPEESKPEEQQQQQQEA